MSHDPSHGPVPDEGDDADRLDRVIGEAFGDGGREGLGSSVLRRLRARGMGVEAVALREESSGATDPLMHPVKRPPPGGGPDVRYQVLGEWR
jgi:hypothetical protein